jgi:hypothetical protein
VVENFNGPPPTGSGIRMVPLSGAIRFVIANTIVSNNRWAGILYAPIGGATANGVIDNVVATNNEYGIQIFTIYGGPAAVAISNSTAGGNRLSGIELASDENALAISVDNTSTSSNGYYGIDAAGTTEVILGRSVITANGLYGVENLTIGNTFYSYQDNAINGNSTDIRNPLVPLARN